MTEPHERFVTLHVLMTERGRLPLTPRFVTSMPFWGSEVYLGRWAAYDADVLRRRYGAGWPKQWAWATARDLFRIVGERADGGREVLKDPRGEAPGEVPPRRTTARVETETDLVRRLVAARAKVRGRKPGLGETAIHLSEHEPGVVYDLERTARLLSQVNGNAVLPGQVPAYRSEGHRRLERPGMTCRYCEIA